MKQCPKCNLWFPEGELCHTDLMAEEEDCCAFCNEPWASNEHAIPGAIRPPEPANISQAACELLEKTQIKVTKFDVLLPMPGDPSQCLVEASIYRDKNYYWYVEGNDRKFKYYQDALYYVVEMAEARRHALLNKEFEEKFGGT